MNKDVLITISTPYGDMKAILYDETPLHKKNFIELSESGQFDSTIFHRVIENFMIQGGDVNLINDDEVIDYTIPAEFNNNLFHRKGEIAAARMGGSKMDSGDISYLTNEFLRIRKFKVPEGQRKKKIDAKSIIKKFKREKK